MARDTGTEILISHRSKIYKLSLEDTGRRIKRKYKRSVAPLIDEIKCPECSHVMINNVCLNPACEAVRQ